MTYVTWQLVEWDRLNFAGKRKINSLKKALCTTEGTTKLKCPTMINRVRTAKLARESRDPMMICVFTYS